MNSFEFTGYSRKNKEERPYTATELSYDHGSLNSETQTMLQQIPDIAKSALPDDWNLSPVMNNYVNVQELYPKLIYIDPKVLYDRMSKDANGVLPKEMMLVDAVNIYYEEARKRNVSNIYNNAASFFADNFTIPGGRSRFEAYQLYIYLLCFIRYVLQTTENLDFRNLAGYNTIYQWCNIRRDPNIEQLINGPTSNTNLSSLDFTAHYKTIINAANETSNVIEYNQLTTAKTISKDLFSFYDYYVNAPNVYSKSADAARAYNVTIDSAEGVTMEIDTLGNLVFDCSRVNLGDTRDQSLYVNYNELETSSDNNYMQSKINVRKLAEIFQQYSRVKISELVLSDIMYLSPLNAYKKLFVVFDGVQCSERNIYNTASGSSLIIGGNFVHTDRGYEFKQDIEAVTYRSKLTDVKSFRIYITERPGSATTITTNTYIIKLDKLDIFNHPFYTGLLPTSNYIKTFSSKTEKIATIPGIDYRQIKDWSTESEIQSLMLPSGPINSPQPYVTRIRQFIVKSLDKLNNDGVVTESERFLRKLLDIAIDYDARLADYKRLITIRDSPDYSLTDEESITLRGYLNWLDTLDLSIWLDMFNALLKKWSPSWFNSTFKRTDETFIDESLLMSLIGDQDCINDLLEIVDDAVIGVEMPSLIPAYRECYNLIMNAISDTITEENAKNIITVQFPLVYGMLNKFVIDLKDTAEHVYDTINSSVTHRISNGTINDRYFRIGADGNVLFTDDNGNEFTTPLEQYDIYTDDENDLCLIIVYKTTVNEPVQLDYSYLYLEGLSAIQLVNSQLPYSTRLNNRLKLNNYYQLRITENGLETAVIVGPNFAADVNKRDGYNGLNIEQIDYSSSTISWNKIPGDVSNVKYISTILFDNIDGAYVIKYKPENNSVYLMYDDYLTDDEIAELEKVQTDIIPNVIATEALLNFPLYVIYSHGIERITGALDTITKYSHIYTYENNVKMSVTIGEILGMRTPWKSDFTIGNVSVDVPSKDTLFEKGNVIELTVNGWVVGGEWNGNVYLKLIGGGSMPIGQETNVYQERFIFISAIPVRDGLFADLYVGYLPERSIQFFEHSDGSVNVQFGPMKLAQSNDSPAGVMESFIIEDELSNRISWTLGIWSFADAQFKSFDDLVKRPFSVDFGRIHIRWSFNANTRLLTISDYYDDADPHYAVRGITVVVNVDTLESYITDVSTYREDSGSTTSRKCHDILWNIHTYDEKREPALSAIKANLDNISDVVIKAYEEAIPSFPSQLSHLLCGYGSFYGLLYYFNAALETPSLSINTVITSILNNPVATISGVIGVLLGEYYRGQIPQELLNQPLEYGTYFAKEFVYSGNQTVCVVSRSVFTSTITNNIAEMSDICVNINYPSPLKNIITRSDLINSILMTPLPIDTTYSPVTEESIVYDLNTDSLAYTESNGVKTKLTGRLTIASNSITSNNEKAVSSHQNAYVRDINSKSFSVQPYEEVSDIVTEVVLNDEYAVHIVFGTGLLSNSLLACAIVVKTINNVTTNNPDAAVTSVKVPIDWFYDMNSNVLTAGKECSLLIDAALDGGTITLKTVTLSVNMSDSIIEYSMNNGIVNKRSLFTFSSVSDADNEVVDDAYHHMINSSIYSTYIDDTNNYKYHPTIKYGMQLIESSAYQNESMITVGKINNTLIKDNSEYHLSSEKQASTDSAISKSIHPSDTYYGEMINNNLMLVNGINKDSHIDSLAVNSDSVYMIPSDSHMYISLEFS